MHLLNRADESVKNHSPQSVTRKCPHHRLESPHAMQNDGQILAFGNIQMRLEYELLPFAVCIAGVVETDFAYRIDILPDKSGDMCALGFERMCADGGYGAFVGTRVVRVYVHGF